jgi:hypothetical protein
MIDDSDDYQCTKCKREFKWEKLTQTPEGNLFCAECWQLFKNEPKRLCPVDGSEMEKHLVAEVVNLDRCRKCDGVWFDGGEFAQVVKYYRPPQSSSMPWIIPFFWGS